MSPTKPISSSSAYLDALLDAGRELGKMAIDRGKRPRMIDADPIAVSGIRGRADDDAVGRGVDRRAGRRREIDALMHEHRVELPRRLRRLAWLGSQSQGNAKARGSVEHCALAAHTAGRLVGTSHCRTLAERGWQGRLVERIGAQAEARRDCHGVEGQAYRRRRRGLSVRQPKVLDATQRAIAVDGDRSLGLRDNLRPQDASDTNGAYLRKVKVC